MTLPIGTCWLIQYHSPVHRGETANVGLVVYAPQQRLATVHFAGDFKQRVRRVGADAGLADAALMQRDAVKARIMEHSRDLGNVRDAVEHARSRQANAVQLCAPEDFRVTDPQRDLERLIVQYLGAPTTTSRGPTLARRFAELLAAHDLDEWIKRDRVIDVPSASHVLPATRVTFPFAYRNGVDNPVWLPRLSEPNDVEFAKTALFAHSAATALNKQDARLVVVTESSSADAVAQFADYVRPAGAEVFDIRESDKLFDEIKEAQRLHPEG